LSHLKRICLLILFSFLFVQAAELKGLIINSETSKALSSANIYFTNSQIGTVSDKYGEFSLKIPTIAQDTLCVSMMGYQKYCQLIKFPVDKDFLIKLSPAVLKGDDVIVFATRIPGSARQSSISLDIINQDELVLFSATDIAGILRGLRSLQIRDYGGAAAMKTLSLRGATAGQTLIILDGQRLNNPQNGEVDLSLIPLDHIERIEVLRGGTSALYGADALGGVISIKTKEAAEDKIEFSFEGALASFSTTLFKGDLQLSTNGLQLFSSYEHLSSQGDFSYTNIWGEQLIRDNNDIVRSHFYSKLSYTPKNYKVSFSLDALKSERGAPGPIEPYYHYARMEDKRQNYSLDIETYSPDKKHKFRSQSFLFYSSNHYINEDERDVLVPINDKYLTYSWGEELQVLSTFRPELILNYGVNLRVDQFKHQRLNMTFKRISYDAFIIDESYFDFNSKIIKSLKISPSLRFNGNTDFSNKLTPKIGLLLGLFDNKTFAITANAGLSYRSPTFNDLYWPEDSFSRGNPDLRPESGRDWDMGLRLKLDRLKLDIVYFDQHMSDLILWQDHDGLWWPENVSKARIRGLENSLSWDIIPEHLELYAQYTFMDARNLSQQYYNKYLVYRPLHSTHIQLNGKINALGLSFRTHMESKRYTLADNAEIHALVPYIKHDFSGNYCLKTAYSDILFKAEIRNIFDVSYTLLKDYPLPGREYIISVKFNFKQKIQERK